MSSFRLFVYEEDGDTFAYLLPFFQTFALTTEQAVTDVYAEVGGKWEQVNLKPLTAGTERDVKRAARVPDIERGFVLDETELPAARAATCIQSWTFAGEPTKEAYNSLPSKVAALIDSVICTRLYGGAIDNRFLNHLKLRPSPSGENPPSPSVGATATNP